MQPIEEDMLGKDYLAGDFTAADTMLGHSIMMANRMGIVNDAHPNLLAYVEAFESPSGFAKSF